MCECDYCKMYKAVFWKDVENNMFVDGNEMLATVKGQSFRVKIKYCPMCGRKFGGD